MLVRVAEALTMKLINAPTINTSIAMPKKADIIPTPLNIQSFAAGEANANNKIGIDIP